MNSTMDPDETIKGRLSHKVQRFGIGLMLGLFLVIGLLCVLTARADRSDEELLREIQRSNQPVNQRR